MALVKWEKHFEIGIPLIDDEHKEIFEALNRLHEAIQAGEVEGAVAMSIAFLVDRAANHFQDEETLMVAMAYPGLAEHRAEHTRTLSLINADHARYLADQSSITALEVGEHLAFLLKHIMGQDHSFAVFVKATRA